jgi:hypothetical protein
MQISLGFVHVDYARSLTGKVPARLSPAWVLIDGVEQYLPDASYYIYLENSLTPSTLTERRYFAYRHCFI